MDPGEDRVTGKARGRMSNCHEGLVSPEEAGDVASDRRVILKSSCGAGKNRYGSGVHGYQVVIFPHIPNLRYQGATLRVIVYP